MWLLIGILLAGLRAPALGPSKAPAADETVVAIQVHGNTLTSDEEVRTLAGVRDGMPLEATTVADVIDRLTGTKRFHRVQVLKRFASISDPSRILLVIIVDEGPVHIEMTGNPSHPTRVVRNRGPNVMFMPVLGAEDGYGVTYGGRVALLNPAGARSQLAFPLTWGGDRRAAAEFEKTLARAPIDRVTGGVSISRRTNPFFDQHDDRTRVWTRAERALASSIRLGAAAGWQRASFLGAEDRFEHAGADITVDTRRDPGLPRNAVYAKASWERLWFGANRSRAAAGVNGRERYTGAASRTDLDAHGYVGLLGQSVLAVRAQRRDSDRPLPPYLQPLLGGTANVRGFAAGTAIGDTLVATSAELIVPLSSPISVGRMGVSLFVDTGTVYAKGDRFADQTMKRGDGARVWFTAAFLRLNVAVAHGRGSSTRVHVGGNVSF